MGWYVRVQETKGAKQAEGGTYNTEPAPEAFLRRKFLRTSCHRLDFVRRRAPEAFLRCELLRIRRRLLDFVPISKSRSW